MYRIERRYISVKSCICCVMRSAYRDYVKTNMILENADDMRDNRAIEAGASAMLKILFPDNQPTDEDFYRYCVNPALEMRQRVRDELCKMDREYEPMSMRSQYPDEFQLTHHRAEYIDSSQIDPKILTNITEYEQVDEPVEQILLGTPINKQTQEDTDRTTVRKISPHQRKRIWL